jgi:nitrite reductase (NO-forming)
MTKADIFKTFFVAGLFVLASCGNETSTNNNNNSTAPTASVSSEEKTDYPAGKTVYQKTCITCHMATGTGMQGTYPPLANSDFLLADKFRAIHQVIKGSATKYTVNGNEYNGVMPPQQLSDEEVAQVLSYVYHSWGNNGFVVTAADVKSVRDTLK